MNSMDLLQITQSYFRGERWEALWFVVPLGLAFAFYGVVALRAESGGFAWGAAVPAFVFAALLLVPGLTIVARTPAQVAAVVTGLKSDRTATVRTERDRMATVMANFRTYRWAFLALVLIGLVGALVPIDWLRSAGAVLVVGGGMGLVIDGFAERRGHVYEDALIASSINPS